LKAREIKPGAAEALHNYVIGEITSLLLKGKFRPLLSFLQEAVAAFNTIEIHDQPMPQIGIVGEIFVKYNPFSNNDIVDWLIHQGAEVILPSLINFFTQRFVNEEYDQRYHLKSSLKDRISAKFLYATIHSYLRRIEDTMQGYSRYRRNYDLHELALQTAKITSLANQAGEGWLLTAEMLSMHRNGINTIVCLQPFGCLPNHITGKGIEKRMSLLYPRLNLHFLDMDAGASKVNIQNRLHFILEQAKNPLSHNIH
jgi:predicted nucleotide-binding protein (sugar kinase/HSP70/actin superfamily)